MAVPRVVTLELAGVSGHRWPVGHFVTTHAKRRRSSHGVCHFAVRRPGGNVMIELLEQQKKLTANQWKLICTANLADLLDFFDFFLIG
jgi:hypothetical protein